MFYSIHFRPNNSLSLPCALMSTESFSIVKNSLRLFKSSKLLSGISQFLLVYPHRIRTQLIILSILHSLTIDQLSSARAGLMGSSDHRKMYLQHPWCRDHGTIRKKQPLPRRHMRRWGATSAPRKVHVLLC